MYLMLGTRPDLAYCVEFLSRSLNAPNTKDVANIKKVLRCITGTCNLGIIYTSTGRSTTGLVVNYAGGGIS